MKKVFHVIKNFFEGKFGYCSLNYPYRVWWKVFWSVIFVWLFVRFIMFPFFRWWEEVVMGFNHFMR